MKPGRIHRIEEMVFSLSEDKRISFSNIHFVLLLSIYDIHGEKKSNDIPSNIKEIFITSTIDMLLPVINYLSNTTPNRAHPETVLPVLLNHDPENLSHLRHMEE